MDLFIEGVPIMSWFSVEAHYGLQASPLEGGLMNQTSLQLCHVQAPSVSTTQNHQLDTLAHMQAHVHTCARMCMFLQQIIHTLSSSFNA